MRRRFRQIFGFFLLAGWLTEAAAIDPVVGLIWSLVQDRLLNAAAQAASAPPAAQIIAPDARALGIVDPRELKALVNDNFAYLTSSQRDEIYQGLEKIMTDPKHVAIRGVVLERFTETAKAVGEAHRRLSNLTHSEKRRVAAEIRLAYERSSAPMREELLQMVQSHQLPLPSDLNRMVLDELGRGARGIGE
ncbi:MAG: hypothetical protein HYU77_04850 [Betaproteobacteria bacterium]|nr:hypothetical protein [Betaproteobacteria bacterium]